MKKMRKCPKCGEYTLAESHCVPAVSAYPPRYSPQDKYANYRRKAREESQ